MKSPLDLQLTGRGALPDPIATVRSTAIDRLLGGDVLVTHTVEMPAGGGEERRMSEAMGRGEAIARGEYAPIAAVRQARRLVGGRAVRLVADATLTDPAFLDRPRRRAIHAADARQLVGRFSPEVTPLPCVANALEALKFPQQPDATIIQDGLSDRDVLRDRLLGELARLEPRPEQRHLILNGSLDTAAGTAGKLVLAWTDPEAYRRAGALDRRLVRPDADDGRCRAELPAPGRGGRRPIEVPPSFGSGGTANSTPPDGATGWRATCPYSGRPRRTLPPVPSSASSTGWSSTGAGRINWTSMIWTVPPDVRRRVSRRPPATWSGVAKVEASDPAKIVYSAKVAGFEPDGPGSDRLHVRVGSAYTGPDGLGGMVFVPDPGREVKLRWSGRPDEPIEEEGQPREQPPRRPAPAVLLDEPLRLELGAVTLVIGKVEVISQLEIWGREGIKLGCKDPLVLAGDDTRSEHRGGVLRVGGG